MNKLLVSLAISTMPLFAAAQTDISLGWRSDSLQISKMESETGDEYRKVLHHGPAVENQFMAVRIYFNNSGAIDVYSKSKAGLELSEYHWYPTLAEIEAGAGCDEYRVGSTIGLGGISLWDGEKEVKLVATKGREAKTEKIKGGAKIEMLSKGILYKSDTIDVLVTIVALDSEKRWMTVFAECTSGQKVQFLTGVNYHKGQQIDMGKGYMAAWGVHPADVVENPLPIGGGMRYKTKKFIPAETTNDLMRIISKPTKKISTQIIAACSKEQELNNHDAFLQIVKK